MIYACSENARCSLPPLYCPLIAESCTRTQLMTILAPREHVALIYGHSEWWVAGWRDACACRRSERPRRHRQRGMATEQPSGCLSEGGGAGKVKRTCAAACVTRRRCGRRLRALKANDGEATGSQVWECTAARFLNINLFVHARRWPTKGLDRATPLSALTAGMVGREMESKPKTSLSCSFRRNVLLHLIWK